MLIRPPPADCEPRRRFVESLVGGRVFRSGVQLRPELVLAHAEDVEQPAVPERLLVEPTCSPSSRYTGIPSLRSARIALRSPRAPRLPVTDRLAPKIRFTSATPAPSRRSNSSAPSSNPRRTRYSAGVGCTLCQFE